MMRPTTMAALAAVLMMGAAPTVYAQSGGGDQSGQQQFEQDRDQQRSEARSGNWERSAQERRRAGEEYLRDALREAGFSRIRILDATYTVQARSPDGRNVLMFVDPPARMAMGDRDRFQTDEQDQSRMSQMGRDRQQQDRFAQNRLWQQDRDTTGSTGWRDQDQRADRRTGDLASDFQGDVPRDRIRAIIEARGMSDLEDLRREGDVFVGTADWYGDEVDLRIDAETGELLQPRRLEPGQVRTKLQDEGWSDVRDVAREGGAFFARATRDGQDYQVMIDARTGEILAARQTG